MDNNPILEGTTRRGTLSGTILVLLLGIRGDDLLKTAVLAALGAVVSFAVSLALRWLRRQLRGKA